MKKLQSVPTNRVTYVNPDDPWKKRAVIKVVEKLTGQPKLQRLYNDYMSKRDENDVFWHTAIDYLELNVNYNQQMLDAIPKNGPLVMIANHPFGVLDGIAIGHLASLVRSDVKIMAHAALGRADAFVPYLIPVEFDGDSSALRSNVASKREAIDHIKNGGLLIIFPAGRVSTADKVMGRATDAPWKLFAGKLIASSKATVIPIYFEGQNGRLFHFVSKFSSVLREALILREVAKRIGSQVTAHIGKPIEEGELSHFSDSQLMLDFLRQKVYELEVSNNNL
ncbi:lysophospholipid acyltransferase family protein [Curvivirga aplysinae]|uniref:lysophospholipid acyltransferase family protein n=1 Tax=Curvivirga aplysinae TaxID=2529852 RepID=UPI0012BBFCDC|nr:lysophospholipid acyltransferase family protein [Curvivirga aplysinae]MTI10675.1 glycerol acyltransferase [Curvivirga aplysinae]